MRGPKERGPRAQLGDAINERLSPITISETPVKSRSTSHNSTVCSLLEDCRAPRRTVTGLAVLGSMTTSGGKTTCTSADAVRSWYTPKCVWLMSRKKVEVADGVVGRLPFSPTGSPFSLACTVEHPAGKLTDQ